MPIGQAERQTQQRVIQLFQKTLGYQYLGHWQDRPDNRNIETELLEAFLTEQGHSAALIQRTLHLLNRAANDQTQGLYACNKAVYDLLRYDVPVKADKQKSAEVFGGYIHTYKFNEAVRDGVVPDLRYEARNIDQALTSPERIDQWFAAKTRGLTDIALVKEQHDY